MIEESIALKVKDRDKAVFFARLERGCGSQTNTLPVAVIWALATSNAESKRTGSSTRVPG